MMRKFAVALIATTMLVAPALAADAVKPTQPAPAAAATTVAPADASAPKSDAKADSKAGAKTVTKSDAKSDVKSDTKSVTESATKTGKELKRKVAHSHHAHQMTHAKSGGHASHVRTAKMSKPAAPVMTWFQWTVPATKTEKHVKTFKVAHHHMHHVTFARNGKPASHVETAKVTKPVDAVATTPAASTSTPAAANASKPDVKVIKAIKSGKELKKSHVTAANVSNPVKPATEGKAGGDVAHEAKSNKVITN
jgi:hypothetical protein